MTDAIAEYRKYNKRPTAPKKFTAAVREALLEAWSWEWPDTKACQHAGISTGLLYHVMKVEPQLKSQRDLIRQTPLLASKKNVSDAVQTGDLRTSKWLLERRDPEYSSKQQVDVQVTHSVAESDVAKELLAFIERNQLIAADNQDIIDITPTDAHHALPEAQHAVHDDPLLS